MMRALLGAGIVAGVALCAGPVPPAAPARPSVVLVTLDTTRADRLGCYGRAGAGTPNLDRLAASGVRFADAWSVAPITLPAHLSILTGCLPPTHGVRDNGGARFDGKIPTLAARFAAAGYKTAAVVSAPVLGSDWGVDAGFGVFDETFEGARERTAAAATARALEIRGKLTEPYFLWVHYYDPHWTYEPPPPYAERFKDDPYQGEIAYVDAELGRLLAELGKGDRKPIVVVAADHGEALGEHGEKTHGIFTYRSTLSVPLLIAGPGIPAGRVVAAPVSLVDVAPTIAELAGLPPAKTQDGVSLAALLGGASAPSRSLYYESMLPFDSYGWVPPRGVSDGLHAFIELPKREVYDLKADPAQSRNVYAPADPLSKGLASRFEETAAALAERAGRGAPATLTDEERAKLSSLGYFAGAPSGAATPTLDPKDVVGLVDRIEQALRAQREGRLDEALATADEVLERSPGNSRALSVRGWALLSKKRYGDAAAAFGEVVKRNPAIAIYRCDLAQALSASGQAAKAEAEWRRAIAIEPHLPEPRASLIAASLARKDTAKALAVAGEAAASGTTSAELEYQIGRAFQASGRLDEAGRRYRAALKLRPDDARAKARLREISR